MKALLVRPPLPERAIGAAHASLCEPLELEVLAGNLRGHDVTIVDMRLDDTPFDTLLQEVKPDLVGVTAGTVEVTSARAIVRRVKEVFPAVATIVGGPHATARPEDFGGKLVNAVVLGQGVETLQEVVEARESGRPLEEIAGLVVNLRDGRQLRTAPRQRVENLGIFPAPDRRSVDSYRPRYYHGWVRPVALVQGSSGVCHPGVVGAPLLESRVVQEVERVAAEMVEQEMAVCLADDDALVEPARTARLCALLKEAGFDQPLYLCTRAEEITDNPAIIEDLAEVGLVAVALALDGPESGGPSAVQREAVDFLHSAAVAVAGEFQALASFDAQDFRRLGDWAAELDIEFPVFSTPTPFPGSPMFEEHRETLGTPDWELFDRVHIVLPTRLPLRDFYAELARLYEQSYGLTSIPRVARAVPWGNLWKMSKQLRSFSRRLRQAHRDQESGLHRS